MAKQLTINDPTTGVTYTLEYTRKTVEAMEKNGFVAADVEMCIRDSGSNPHRIR